MCINSTDEVIVVVNIFAETSVTRTVSLMIITICQLICRRSAYFSSSQLQFNHSCGAFLLCRC